MSEASEQGKQHPERQAPDVGEVIVEAKGLRQVSDSTQITEMNKTVLAENPEQVAAYLAGKESLLNWFFGQVMRAAKGKANPQMVREELNRQLAERN